MSTKPTANVATDQSVPVVPFVRLIPNGRTDDRFCATLLITPICPTKPDGLGAPTPQVHGDAVLDLQCWPTAIADLLARGAVRAEIAVHDDAKTSCLTPVSPIEMTVAFQPDLLETIKCNATKLHEIWQRSVVPPHVDGKPVKSAVACKAWQALATTIRMSLSGERTKATLRDNGVALAEGNFGRDGQLAVPVAQDVRTIKSILTIPYAEAANALEMQRADDLCRSLNAIATGNPKPLPKVSIPTSNGTLPQLTPSQLKAKLASVGSVDDDQLDVQRDLFAVIGRYTPFTELDSKTQERDAFDRAVIATAIEQNLKPARETGADLDKFRGVYPVLLTSAGEANLTERLRQHRISRFNNDSIELDAQRRAARAAYDAARPAVRGETPRKVCGQPSPMAREHANREAADKSIGAACQAMNYGHWPHYEREPIGGRSPDDLHKVDGQSDEDAVLQQRVNEATAQGYFAIEGHPSLARAFGLAFDVELTLKPGEKLPDARFAIISASIAVPDGVELPPRPWTLTKLAALDHRDEDRARFWPATMSEYVLWRDYLKERAADPSTRLRLPSHCIPQFNGVYVADAVESTAEAHSAPRFDITSLDVRAALKAEDERRKTIAQEFDEKDQPDANPSLGRDGLATSLADGADHQSTGLTILSRLAQLDAVYKLASISGKCGGNAECVETCDGLNYVIHDAEDVTNGFRLAIGVPQQVRGAGAWTLTWRPLAARVVRFGDGASESPIETILRFAVGAPGCPKRIALETAFQAIPARELPAQPDTVQPGGTADVSPVEALIDQTVAVWDGTPGGVACGKVPDSDDPRDSVVGGRLLSVPSHGDLRLPPYRNGRPYRIALVACYAGGHSIPFDELPREFVPPHDASDDDTEAARIDVRARLYYPSLGRIDPEKDTDAAPYIRALRHGKIGAPAILLPKGHADRWNGPTGFENVDTLIVRTVTAEPGVPLTARARSLAEPCVAQRLVVVPSVPQALAVGHHVSECNHFGVLDAVSAPNGPPPGGLSNVRFGKDRDGFPSIVTTSRTGINGEPYVLDRELSSTVKPSDLGRHGADSAAKAASGAVYWPADAATTDYYPDPAADVLVIRARRRAGTTGDRPPLPGTPLCVPLTSGRTYPDVARVLLSLRRSRTRLNRELRQESVLKHAGTRRIDANSRNDIVRSYGHAVEEVELRLDPGDQFDLDLWLVPSPWRLAHDFAVVQSLAQLAAAGNRWHEVADALSEACGSDANAFLIELEAARSQGKRYVGSAGVLLPGTECLKCLAAALHTVLLRHPLPELCGVRRLVAVHAVNRPQQRPVIRGLDALRDPFPAPACEAAEGSGLRPLRAVRPAALGKNVTGYADDAAIAAGSTLFALKGDVKIDTERVDTLEVVASTVSPESPLFDDRSRGRSMALRLAGEWPDTLAPGDGKGPRPKRKAQDIFGFKVDRLGRTAMTTGELTLLRIDGLPFRAGGETEAVVRLDEHFLDLNKDLPGAGTTSRRHAFPDGKARRLFVTVNALARTAEHLTAVARVARPGDPWLNNEGLRYEAGELIPSEPIDARYLRNVSPRVEVVLPATIRPARPVVFAPVPLIESDEPQVSRSADGVVLRRTRQARTRIPLGRGWFSSGVDERLGIVLWPPEQSLADGTPLARNVVPLRDTPQCPGERGADRPRCAMIPLGDEPKPGPVRRRVDLSVPSRTDLPPFADEDLGPGGVFVTRRGMDPVRIGPSYDPTFSTAIVLTKGDFPDLWRDPRDPQKAEFVPSVPMPLSDMGDEANADPAEGWAEPDSQRTPGEMEPPLTVALVTYVPLFDPEREEWFVDVLLGPSRRADEFVRFGLVRYQPNTRTSLRASRPVVQWAQPLPERTVTVALRRAGTVEVTIEGSVSTGRASETEDDTIIHKRDQPVMRISAFTDARSPVGGSTREPVDLIEPGSNNIIATNVGNDGAYEVSPEVVDGFGRWRFTFPAKLLDQTMFMLSLHIEEVDYFLAAEPVGEPLSLEKFNKLEDELWQRSGPRFSMVVDLSALAPMHGRD